MKLAHPKRDPFMEVVLEDGRFARIRRLTRCDWCAGFAGAGNPTNFAILMAIVVSRTTTVDDEAISISDWMESDTEFTEPIVNAINTMLRQANENPNKGGIA